MAKKKTTTTKETVKKSAVENYLEVETKMLVAFKELTKLTKEDLIILAEKSRVYKDWACEKIIESGATIKDLLKVIKVSPKLREKASGKLMGKLVAGDEKFRNRPENKQALKSEPTDDDLRFVIQNSVNFREQASYELSERKKKLKISKEQNGK